MIIGIPKETKKSENRIALTPQAVKELTTVGISVMVEQDAGLGSGWTDKEYIQAGATIVDTSQIYKAEMIVRVKEPDINTLQENQILLGYLHIEKGQNNKLLQALLKKNITSFGYHVFFDEKGKRQITLSYEAGVVGIYEGLRLCGSLQKRESLASLPSSWECKTEQNIIKSLQTVRTKEKQLRIYILGNGKVAKGCMRVLNRAEIPYFVLFREDTENIKNYLPKADMIVNAVYWKATDVPIITKDLMQYIQPTTPIIDISCDENGSIETSIPTTWENPTYTTGGITHFAVDNLPSAIAKDSSEKLSNMLMPFVKEIARKNGFSSGMLTKNGTYIYRQQF